jgi:two-component system, OmpR family, sensor kinase
MTAPSSDGNSAPRDLSHAEMALFAHELRGALTVIAGYTALLRHPLGEHEQAAALDGIERAIARADSLCGDALAGRAPAPSKARIRELVSIPELAEQTAADQRSATSRDVRLRIEAGAQDLVVTGDGQALARVLGNLVGNAAKYSPSDTPIDVRVSREVRPFLGDAAIIEVCDRGPGVPTEMREVVFEPFQRLARDESTQGTGLGLAVTRSVVVAHDGRVGILDRDGGGTVVRVELPAEASKAE